MSPLVVAALIIVHTFWFPLVCLATSRSQFVIFPFTLSFFIDSPSPVDCWSIKIVIYCTSFFAPWILYGYIMIHIYIHIQIIYILYIYKLPKIHKEMSHPVAFFGVARLGRAAWAPALPPRATDGAAAAAELQGLSVAGGDLAEGLQATPGLVGMVRMVRMEDVCRFFCDEKHFLGKEWLFLGFWIGAV